MYTGYYCKKQQRESDKYNGLLSKKQLADLESETDLKVTRVSDLKKKVQAQRKDGASNALGDPLGRGATNSCWTR